MKHSFTLFALAAALAATAFGDTINFSFTGANISASGSLTISASSTPGVDYITGITGTYTDTKAGINGKITGLYAPVSYTTTASGGHPAFTNIGGAPGFSYDDTFYPGGDSPIVCNPAEYPFHGGLLDIFGIAFDISGGFVADVWSNGVVPNVGLTYSVSDSSASAKLDTGVAVAFGAAPEPGSLLLVGVGLAGLLAAKVRRNKAAA